MARRPRVLYLQLPVPDFGDDYAGANHPLAGGYLAAHALARGVVHEPVFLPPAWTSRGADPFLVEAILEAQPEVIAASLQLWNVGRTLRILQTVRRRRPMVRLLAGGPEVDPAFARRFPGHGFDWWCCGEGEGPFEFVLRLLADHPRASPAELFRAGRAAPSTTALDDLPSPYLSGLLPPAPDGSLWVETMRGCPFRCAYCAYGLSSHRVRRFPQEWLGSHLAWARRRRASEVYLLDPSFQITPGLERRLTEIAEINRGGLPLHTEARVDGLTPRLADLFAAAGFRSIETGLQSIHPQVLRAIRRQGDARRFARGARLLKRRGARLQVDVILGLPGDTPEGFLRTIDFLVQHDLAGEAAVFPLLLLPGTPLRDQARTRGIRFQSAPPYQVRSTGAFDLRSMREALSQAEARLGTSLYPLHLPDLGTALDHQGPLRRVEIDLGRQRTAGLTAATLRRLAHNPVLLFQLPPRVPWPRLIAWADWLKTSLPDLMPFIGLKTDRPFSLLGLKQLLGRLHDPESTQARLWSLSPDPYLRLSCRPFVLSRCQGLPDFWLEANQVLPVIRIVAELHQLDMPHPLGALPILLDTPRTLAPVVLSRLADRFRDRQDELLFSWRPNTLAWARHTAQP
jgi:hypothetical protein